MFKKLVIWSILVTLSPLAFGEQPPGAPKADEVARRAVDMAGGGGAWEKARYFSFNFKVIRDGKEVNSFSEKLDRFTGDYRVSGIRPDGAPFEAIVNIASKKVRGTVSGKPVTEKGRLDELYDMAFVRLVNDMNWLLLPFEMFYNGIQRTYEGERTDSCEHVWDVVKLTFDAGLGFTPGDNYWLWVNRDTGLVEEWDIKLAASPAEEAPLRVNLHDYRRVGGLLISLRRELKGKNQIMQFENVQILPEVPKGAFE